MLIIFDKKKLTDWIQCELMKRDGQRKECTACTQTDTNTFNAQNTQRRNTTETIVYVYDSASEAMTCFSIVILCAVFNVV